MMTELTTTNAGQIATANMLDADDAQRVSDAIKNSKSKNTLRVYTSQWRRFTAWCTRKRYEALPATPETVAAYLVTIANANARYVARAAIGKAHKLAKAANPTTDELVTEASRGATRKAAAEGERERKAHALALADLERIVAHLDTHPDATSQRDATLLACGWWSACRRSELATWRIEDVTFSPDGASVFLPMSKTDQQAEGQHVYLPLHVAARLRAFIGDRRRGFVFWTRPITRNRSARDAGSLEGGDVARILKRRASDAGIENAHKLSGHSFRRGFVTDRRARGATLPDIAEQTRHKSLDTLRGYSDAQSASVKRLLAL